MWTSEYAGRLIDLDLSSVSDTARYDPGDVPLTFSTPFLALDLLKTTMPQRHLYRHDLESFYWSFVWIVLDHLRSKNTRDLLEVWRKGARTTIATAKEGLFLRRNHMRVFSELSHKSPSYKPISDCLKKLTRLMARAYSELYADSETDSDSEPDSPQSGPGLGRERISYEAFLNIFP